MSSNQGRLLTSRRFLPLFITQFLGAFNDNVFKNALVIMVTYMTVERFPVDSSILVTIAAGIFILPFFLLSATAGQIADKYDKGRLIPWTKLAELICMLVAVMGLYMHSIALLLVVLFFMGAQSAFFGPLKYGILPDVLHTDELVGANAFVEASTFLAILIGTIVGGLLIAVDHGKDYVAAILILVAILGYAVSFLVPRAGHSAPDLRIDMNFITATVRLLRHVSRERSLLLCVVGISWFWFVGATLLSQTPVLTRDILGGDQGVVTLLLAMFSIGIGAGSLLCNHLLRGEVHATYVPLGALGMTLFAIDLYVALGSGGASLPESGLMDIGTFLEQGNNWRVLLDILLIAVSGGMYIVPLYAILQSQSRETHRARNIASNNVLNAMFMVLSAVLAASLLGLGWTIPHIILLIAMFNLVVAIGILRLLPGALAKALIAWLLQTVYRIQVVGLRNYRKAGDRVLIVANHSSFIDAALIAAFVPDRLTFAINTNIAKLRIVRFFLSLARTYPVDPANPMSMRALIHNAQQGEKIVVFPEGRITVTGSLMKIYEGPGLIADKADAQILPVRIEGAQYTPFSYLRGKVRIRWFPKITLHFLEPRSFKVPNTVSGRGRRQRAAQMLFDLMTGMLFESSSRSATLFRSLLDARKVHGGSHPALDDANRRPVNYKQMVRNCFVLGRRLECSGIAGDHVGILLPNMVSSAIVFFALQAYGRIPAMINFSSGTGNIIAACNTAKIKTIITSKRFIEGARLEDAARELRNHGVRLIDLESLRDEISFIDKLLGWIGSHFSDLAYRRTCRQQDAHRPAVILFTSGTEGTPKGVVLSHDNLQANRHQTSALIDFGPSDTVFNALPMFHSFGLTCGTLLPLLSGLKVFLYPSPLHYRVIPEMVYETNATIMFGTDTFLSAYARYAHPYDFYSMRYIFSGAEKLKDETRRLWSDKFGVRVFEGYGATETSPVLTLNTPMQHCIGSVGRLVPGIRYRVESLPDLDEGGRLLVAGPNIMLGYLHPDQPGIVKAPVDGWYDTGDIVTIDEDGFVFIQGRAKRFAKIGGEMISLAAVEDFVSAVWPGYGHAVIYISHLRKGEQLVLLTENKDASTADLLARARAEKISELSVPKVIVALSRLPLAGSGKLDYVTLKDIAEHRVAASSTL